MQMITALDSVLSAWGIEMRNRKNSETADTVHREPERSSQRMQTYLLISFLKEIERMRR